MAVNRWGKMQVFRRFPLEIFVGDLRRQHVVGLGRAVGRSFPTKSNLRDGDIRYSCLFIALAGLPFTRLATGKACVHLSTSWLKGYTASLNP